MGLTRGDFASFFAATHGGSRPYPWQERLLDTVLAEGRWPDRIAAPTGSGKTAVVDVHVFAQAVTAEENPARRPPRRLALVVGRRVLVDDQYEYARRLARLLISPHEVAEDHRRVLREVAERLWSLHRPPPNIEGRPDAASMVSPLVVARLRGGLPTSRAWREDPTAAAVLCATPDMWGSRLLFRGYGARSLAWPREAGLLAFDSAVVVDEAHLSRQLLCTARRVAELAVVAEMPLPVRPLQVVETTATPAGTAHDAVGQPPAATCVAVEPPDLIGDTLTARLTTPKPVTLLPVQDWASPRGPQRRKVAAAMADAVLRLLQGGLGPEPSTETTTVHTVGCFVNTVARAVDVATVLRGCTAHGRPVNVVVICGQIRPHDLEKLRHTYPGVLEPEGNRAVDVIVGTQSLEVGVDLDLAAMVTELTTGSALAQRAGRVNRRGLRPQGPVVVAVPGEEITTKLRSGPYQEDELSEALEWLEARALDPAGLAPWALRDAPPPEARLRRTLLQRPELADAWHWARTSDDLSAEPELDLWLAEDFDDDTSVGLVVRQAMPVDSVEAVELVTHLPPRRHETLSVPYRTARAALRRYGRDLATSTGDQKVVRGGAAESTPAIVVVRGEEVSPLRWRQPEDDEPGQVPLIRPGDMILVDATAELFTGDRSSDRAAFSPPIVIGDAADGAGMERFTAEDVLMAEPDLLGPCWQARERGSVVLRVEDGIVADKESFATLAEALSELRDIEEPDRTDHLRPVAQREVVREWLQSLTVTSGHRGMVASAVTLLDASLRAGGRRLCELHVLEDTEGRLRRVVLLDKRRPDVDEDLRQVWTPSEDPVALDAHGEAVAARAVQLGRKLGLDDRTRRELELAAVHHDDGKADPRFQVRLGGRGPLLLAKSPPGTSRERARRGQDRSGLPANWRHEQRSVVVAQARLNARAVTGTAVPDDGGLGIDEDMVLRLVGTSHGHGRSGFPHTATDLLDAHDEDTLHEIARDLFDAGAWDDLIERTHHRYGVWACAYLEAILRAADGQVSEEGS